MLCTVPLMELALLWMDWTGPLVPRTFPLIARALPLISPAVALMEFTVLLISPAVWSIDAASPMMDLVLPTTSSSCPERGLAAVRMSLAIWFVVTASFTESRLWSIGETWVVMKATFLSIRWAETRVLVSMTTAASAQAITPTRIRSAMPVSSVSLLFMMPPSARPADAAGLGADAGERRVDLLQAAQDVA